MPQYSQKSERQIFRPLSFGRHFRPWKSLDFERGISSDYLVGRERRPMPHGQCRAKEVQKFIKVVVGSDWKDNVFALEETPQSLHHSNNGHWNEKCQLSRKNQFWTHCNSREWRVASVEVTPTAREAGRNPPPEKPELEHLPGHADESVRFFSKTSWKCQSVPQHPPLRRNQRHESPLQPLAWQSKCCTSNPKAVCIQLAWSVASRLWQCQSWGGQSWNVHQNYEFKDKSLTTWKWGPEKPKNFSQSTLALTGSKTSE